MSFVRTIVRTIVRTAPAAVAAVLVAAAARPAAAQQRVLFSWQGRVDREASLMMRGTRVTTPGGWYNTDRGNLRVSSSLPQTDGVVRLRVERGRGAVDVVEQPSSRNDYTAVVRVRDDQNGAGDYVVTAYWQPTGGNVASGGGWGGRGNDDDRNGRDDRNDRDDRRGNRDDRRGDRDDRRRDRDDRRTGGGWGNGGYGNNGGSSNAGTLRWSGRVDGVEEIRIRGRRIDSYAVNGAGANDVRSRVNGSLGGGAYVRLSRAEGRGQVQVVQQPSSSNGYTAVLRVVDRQSGAGYYDIEASW